MSDESKPSTDPATLSHGAVTAEPPDTFTGLRVTEARTKVAGLPGVARALQYVWQHAGIIRGGLGLSHLNRKGGIDCMSCAWPEPDGDRSFAEFCENGAKALAHEMDTRRCGARLLRGAFGRRSVATERSLARAAGPAHRIRWCSRPAHATTSPSAGTTHSRSLPASCVRLPSPDAAAFYTSGRTSNEAAFAYQLFVRQFGTNNLPDCSNMCHESSGSALSATIGVGKGTVTLEDFHSAQLILVVGQNPGTNHPRMLTALQQAKEAGARIVAINPLREAGLVGFMNPQQAMGLLGRATPLADLFLQVKINGDLARAQGDHQDARRRRRGSAGRRDRLGVHPGENGWCRCVDRARARLVVGRNRGRQRHRRASASQTSPIW